MRNGAGIQMYDRVLAISSLDSAENMLPDPITEIRPQSREVCSSFRDVGAEHEVYRCLLYLVAGDVLEPLQAADSANKTRSPNALARHRERDVNRFAPEPRQIRNRRLRFRTSSAFLTFSLSAKEPVVAIVLL